MGHPAANLPNYANFMHLKMAGTVNQMIADAWRERHSGAPAHSGG